MSPPSWLGLPFWLVALGFSVFYGWKARDIFQVKRDDESWAYLTHQFWFNFAGSLCGWAAFWLEAVNVYWYAATGAKIEFSFSDAALVVLAFIGMTGLLPMTIVGLIQEFVTSRRNSLGLVSEAHLKLSVAAEQPDRVDVAFPFVGA